MAEMKYKVSLKNFQNKYKVSITDVQNRYKLKIFCYDAGNKSISDFNENARQKTEEFNLNAETKLNNYNSNAAEKTNQFNNNAAQVLSNLYLAFGLNQDDYSSTTTFNKDDLVVYNHMVYKSLVADNTGHLPTDTDYWKLVPILTSEEE